MSEQLDLYVLVLVEEMKDERGRFSRTLFYLFFRLQLNYLETTTSLAITVSTINKLPWVQCLLSIWFDKI